MNGAEFAELVKAFLAAWSSQEIDRVLACYSDSLSYRDPGLATPIDNKDALARYLDRLFSRLRMTWSLKESHIFNAEPGGVFLWQATFRLADQKQLVEVQGMDLIMVENNLIKRNEVYFDQAVLAQLNQK